MFSIRSTEESMQQPTIPSYDQPVKAEVRRRVLTHAVESLTTQREISAVVSQDSFMKMWNYATGFIDKHTKSNTREKLQPFLSYWLELHQARVGKKRPSELNVLILCGPNPLNDFNELVKLGVPPHNVWAIEGDKELYANAISELAQINFPLRVHCGSLKEFFSIVPQQFDIVYFDACGPLVGGQPATLDVIKELFLNQRLAPLSALITNFSQANMDGNSLDTWAHRIASWYAPRDEQPVPDSEDALVRLHTYMAGKDQKYLPHIQANLNEYYSHFITSFITEFATLFLPWWRVNALPAMSRQLFASKGLVRKAIAHSLDTPNFEAENAYEVHGDATMSVGDYPHLWTCELTNQHIENDPFSKFFHSTPLHGVSLANSIRSISLVRDIYNNLDSHKACSDQFFKVLTKFKWFDSTGNSCERMFCDTPFPHLIADLCIGQIGYPYHSNVEKLKRYKYTAKQTPMYSDVFILDQARYLYDLVPALPFLDKELDIQDQLVMRVCMDIICRHAYNSCASIFYGCALADFFGGEGFTIPKFMERETIEV